MKYIYLLFFSLIIGTSCTPSEKEQTVTEGKTISTINLSVDISKKEFIALSDAIAKIDIIPLELTNSSILGGINKILVTTNDIWINHYNDEYIFRFSRKGKYLNQIGKIGLGPGEYVRLADFFIDETLKEVYLVSFENGINVYDFQGNFRRCITKLKVADLFPAHNNKILFYNQNFFLSQNLPVISPIENPQNLLWSFALVDSSFQIKKMFKNPVHIGREEKIVKNMTKSGDSRVSNYWTENSTNIDCYDNKFSIKFPDTDTIYQYDSASDNFIPVYTIITNEEKGDYELTHQWIKERKAFDYFTILDFFDTKNYIYLTGRKGKTLYTFAYNKENGKVEVNERKGEFMERKLPWFANPYLRLDCPFILTNDLCGGNFHVKYRSNGKYWIDVLEYGTEDKWPDIQTIQKSEVKDEAARQKFLKVLNETGDNSNPVLVIATLK